MATFYLDPEGGNDANDGTTFANRWRTLTNGATAARIAPGDEIRMIAAPDPASIGNATWTNGSKTVTLASAQTQTIWNGDAVWTWVATNVTTSTTTSPRKVGTVSGRIAIAAAFTTGKAAYFTLPSALNLSSWRQIQFWWQASTTGNAINGSVKLQLCSDTTGDTPVITIPLCGATQNMWAVAAYDDGNPLPASIQSIAIVCDADPAAVTIYVQNVIACGPAGGSTTFGLNSVISKTGSDEWYTMDAIDGTTVRILQGSGWSPATGIPGYEGTTETVDTSVWNSTNYYLNATSNSLSYLTSEAGTTVLPITVSGGWNRTDMSTKTGESVLSCGNSRLSCLNVDHVGWVFTDLSILGGVNYGIATNFTSPGNFSFSGKFVLGGAGGSALGVLSDAPWSTMNVTLQQLGMGNRGLFMNADFGGGVLVVDKIHYGSDSGLVFNQELSADFIVVANRISAWYSYGIYTTHNGWYQAANYFKNATITNNGSEDIRTLYRGIPMYLVNCSYSTLSLSSGGIGAAFYSQRHQKVAGAAFLASSLSGFTATLDSAVFPPGATVSWRMEPKTTSLSPTLPCTLSLAKIACAGGSAVTVTVQARRNHTEIQGGIRVRGHKYMGIDTDVVDLMTAAAGTWEELSITFTPSEDTVVEVEAFCYGGTTRSMWFGLLLASQV